MQHAKAQFAQFATRHMAGMTGFVHTQRSLRSSKVDTCFSGTSVNPNSAIPAGLYDESPEIGSCLDINGLVQRTVGLPGDVRSWQQ